MNGINYSELTTWETCHLSKAQRFVSREPRPTPGEPLDEVFLDTVGKLTEAFNGHQHAVILTDAKTRMRWAITTSTKYEISNPNCAMDKIPKSPIWKKVTLGFQRWRN